MDSKQALARQITKDIKEKKDKNDQEDVDDPMLFLKARNNGKMRDYYKILANPLGIGAYGEVRKCYYKENIRDKNNKFKQYRAVKVMSKSYMEEKNVKDFQNEVAVNLILDHPNIAKIHEWFEDEKRYMLVSELCPGGELFQLIAEKKFETREAGIILKQLVSAINYMHSPRNIEGSDDQFSIVHRDLKPENILLTDAEDQMPEIKLIDFGTAKKFKWHQFDENGQIFQYPIGLKEKVGTLNYMAPEIIAMESQPGRAENPDYYDHFRDYAQYFYDEKVDVWSIGVIAYVVLTAHAPFNDSLGIERLMQDIKNYSDDIEWWKQQQNVENPIHPLEEMHFKALPQECQAFIKLCLKRDPVDRIKCEDLLETEWMLNLQEELVQDIIKLDKQTGQETEIHNMAKNSLKALMHFHEHHKGSSKFVDLSEDMQQKIVLKEASLAMIAHLLLDQKHKTTLKKIFKIMDSSGDGQLEAPELRQGFKRVFNNPSDVDEKGNKLCNKAWTDAELNGIIANVDHDENGFLDYRDFLMASVDLTKESFFRYCERAFERFFTNEAIAMPTNELYEILCKENIFRQALVEQILDIFDKDGSDTITFKEMVEEFILHLGDDIKPPVEYADVAAYIEQRFETTLTDDA